MVEERQKPSPGQQQPLSTARVTSNIPKAEFNPDHQSSSTFLLSLRCVCPFCIFHSLSSTNFYYFFCVHLTKAGSEHWEYPSPQMFYNAMLRKGWKPAEGDMNTIVSIHNAVNESGWRQVQAWESLHPESVCHHVTAGLYKCVYVCVAITSKCDLTVNQNRAGGEAEEIHWAANRLHTQGSHSQSLWVRIHTDDLPLNAIVIVEPK